MEGADELTLAKHNKSEAEECLQRNKIAKFLNRQKHPSAELAGLTMHQSKLGGGDSSSGGGGGGGGGGGERRTQRLKTLHRSLLAAQNKRKEIRFEREEFFCRQIRTFLEVLLDVTW